MKDILLEKVKYVKRESKYIEFKEKFDISQAQDWCEIIKDIVAIANSGGGWMLIGIKRDGSPSGWDARTILSLDPALMTDKIAKYTEEQFADFDIQEVEKDGHNLAAIQIHVSSIPMVFTQPGTYDIGGGKQKTAFAKGTIYFRHGAKSEPGNSKDLRDCINREIEQVSKWCLVLKLDRRFY
jgi:predicted HTH transcriptional regulator